MSARVGRALPALALAALALGAWELYADVSSVQNAVLPAPHAVARALWGNRGLVLGNFAVTAKEVILGMVLALCGGFTLAVAIHLSPLLRRAVYPLAVGSQAVPIPVIGVLLVFWWGFGIFPKLVVIALICFFPVLVTTVDGLANVDPEQPKLLRTLDASRWQAFRFAELPAALPGGAQRRPDRAGGGRDRRVHRRDHDPNERAHPGLGREISQRRQFSDGARIRRHARAVRVRAFLLLRSRAGRTQAGPVERPTPRRHALTFPTPRPRVLALAALLVCALALSACATKQDVVSAPASRPFTVMLDFFPNADHAALYTAIAHGDFAATWPGRQAGGPRRPLRTAEAAGRRQGRHGDLLRAGGPARARPGLAGGVDRCTRTASADLDHRAAGQARDERRRPRGQERGHGRHPLPGRRAAHRAARTPVGTPRRRTK